MHIRYASWALVATILAVSTLSGCSVDAPAPAPGTQAPTRTTPTLVAPDGFVNRVWQVAEPGPVAVGDLRVFLSDGTLAMASPNARPALGSWTYEAGRMTIVEEGQRYPTDILELTADTFQIRMHSPGEPIVIRFGRADRSSPATRR